MARFLHVGINSKGRPVPEEKLKNLFNAAVDWMRYAPNCWILWTNIEPEEWYQYIKANLHPDDAFFICELNITNRHGFLARDLWNWIQKKRN
jgi:hypothetical protein